MKIAPIQIPLVAWLWVAEAERGMYVCEYMIRGDRGMYVCDVCEWGYASEYMMCDVSHCAVSVFVYIWRVSCVSVCVCYIACMYLCRMRVICL